MIGLSTTIFKSAGKKLVNLFGSLASRSTYVENVPDSLYEKNHIDDLGVLDKATILLTPTATSDARVHSVKTYTGDEIVDDGNFALTGTQAENTTGTYWSTGANITISGGSATFNNVARYNALFQSSVFELGKTYKLEFTVSNFTEGSNEKVIVQETPNVNPSLLSITTGGNYSVIYTATSNAGITFKVTSVANVSMNLTNISLVDVSSDFDFDRASSATRINSDGLVQDMQSITDPELVLNGDFEELVDVEVTNGDFSNPSIGWITETGWTISDGKATQDGSAAGVGSTGDITSSGPIFEIGETYRIQVDVVDYESGDIDVTSSNISLSVTEDGTYYAYYTATTTYLHIRAGYSDFKGSIDNVSVQQVDPNDRWNAGNKWSISGGTANKATNATSNISQAIDGISGKLQKVVFTVSNYGGSGGVGASADGSNYTENEGNGTFTEYITPNSNNLYIRASYSFVGSIDNVSVKEATFSDDVDLARINYDSNGDNGHILLEPTSTNLITYSEDFEDSSWDFDFSAPYITRTPNAATSPSGENNATKLIGNDASRDPSNSYIGASTSASAPYSASIFAKKGEYDYLVLGIGGYNEGFYAIFNLSNGTVSTSPTASETTASIEDYGNGWFRCIIATTNTSGSEILFITPSVDGTLTTNYTNTTNGIYVWGAQLEALPYATSYIPNHGTALGVTRATETLTGSGNSTLINSTEGVLYAEIATLSEDNNVAFKSLSIAFNSTNKVMITTQSTSLTSVNIRRSDDASNKFVNILTSSESVNFNKIAILYKSGENKIFVNGSRITDTAFDTFTFDYVGNSKSFNKLEFANGSGASNFQGKVKALAVFNEALSDDELELLTGVTNYGSFGELASANGYTII